MNKIQLEDIVGNEETIKRMKVIAETGNLPHILLAVSSFWALAWQGPPGTGKTTSMLCLAHAMLGDAYKTAVIELNASDDRFDSIWKVMPEASTL